MRCVCRCCLARSARAAPGQLLGLMAYLDETAEPEARALAAALGFGIGVVLRLLDTLYEAGLIDAGNRPVGRQGGAADDDASSVIDDGDDASSSSSSASSSSSSASSSSSSASSSSSSASSSSSPAARRRSQWRAASARYRLKNRAGGEPAADDDASSSQEEKEEEQDLLLSEEACAREAAGVAGEVPAWPVEYQRKQGWVASIMRRSEAAGLLSRGEAGRLWGDLALMRPDRSLANWGLPRRTNDELDRLDRLLAERGRPPPDAGRRQGALMLPIAGGQAQIGGTVADPRALADAAIRYAINRGLGLSRRTG